MNNSTIPKYEGTEWRWYFGIIGMRLISKGARDYWSDRERYENSFLTESEKVRKKQGKTIYDISVLLIMVLTTIWSIIPPLISNLPNYLTWMNLGMEGFGSQNWGNQIMLTIVPSFGGTIIHKAPRLIKIKKLQVILDLMLKIIPIIILLITAYLIITQMEYKKFYKLEKQIKLNELNKKITSLNST